MNPRLLSIVGVLFLASCRMLSAWQTAAPCLDRPPSERPYSREHLMDIVKNQSAVRAEYLIRACGVKDPFNRELESDLKEAGAESNVIAAVREMAPKAVIERKPEPVRELPPAPVQAAPEPGDIKVNAKDGLHYVYIPPGTFRMGCSPGDADCGEAEKPTHEVRLTKGFWMAQTDVTVGAYSEYVRAAGKRMPDEPVAMGERHLNPYWKIESVPMSMVTWDDARDYCAWSGMRLPTEAEWEYAARAGTTGARYGVLNDIAWWGGNSGDKAIAADDIWKNHKNQYSKRILENGAKPRGVALKQANAFKLYDMLGNVWQWTADGYQEPYNSSGLETDPKGLSGQIVHVLRGGSWLEGSAHARASARNQGGPGQRYSFMGFRCAGERIR